MHLALVLADYTHTKKNRIKQNNEKPLQEYRLGTASY